VAEEPPAPQEPVFIERSQTDRRTPRYLVDYYVGHMEMFPQRSGTPSRVKTPSLRYRIAVAAQDYSGTNNTQTNTVTWPTVTQLFWVVLAEVGGDTSYP